MSVDTNSDIESKVIGPSESKKQLYELKIDGTTIE
jgi:hypothetical protein